MSTVISLPPSYRVEVSTPESGRIVGHLHGRAALVLISAIDLVKREMDAPVNGRKIKMTDERSKRDILVMECVEAPNGMLEWILITS